MSQQLSDGTVIPSHLGIQSRGSAMGSTAILNDYVLRLGEIKKVIYPTEALSYGRRTVEYEVEVQYREGSSTYSTATYRGCTVSTLFGGVADRFHATLRPDTTEASAALGNGSKVLVLCLAGDQQKAIILGGVEDPLATRQETEGAGHNLFFEINGVRFTVDNDGQLQLLFRGATAVDGKLKSGVDEASGGTTVTITKNGNLTAATKDNKQFLRLNHADRKVEILADQKWDVQVGGQVFIGSGGQFKVQTDADVSFVARARFDVQSAGVTIGSGSQNFLLTNIYRTAENIKNTVLSTQLKTVGSLLTSAGASINIAAPLNAIPIVGGILSLPAWLAAGASITAAGPFLLAASAAIDGFEAGSASYLSLLNFHD